MKVRGVEVQLSPEELNAIYKALTEYVDDRGISLSAPQPLRSLIQEIGEIMGGIE